MNYQYHIFSPYRVCPLGAHVDHQHGLVTGALKRSHLGDFFINTLGYCYKFIQQGNTYKWIEVKDRYIVPYAKQIEKKSSIFIAQPTSEDRYSIGDLWINAQIKRI